MTSPSIRPEKIEELIERLRDGYRIKIAGETIAYNPPTRRDLEAATAIESMAKLLQPFAKMADQMPASKTGIAWGYDSADVTYEDFRAARAFLTAQEESDNG